MGRTLSAVAVAPVVNAAALALRTVVFAVQGAMTRGILVSVPGISALGRPAAPGFCEIGNCWYHPKRSEAPVSFLLAA